MVGLHLLLVSFLSNVFTVITTVAVVTSVTPMFLVGVIPLAVLYGFTQR